MESSTTNIRSSEEQRNGPGIVNSSNTGRLSEENSQRPISIGVVVPTIEARLDNLEKVLYSLIREDHSSYVSDIVVVCDGWNISQPLVDHDKIKYITILKHEPGQEQPRNVGVRHLTNCDYVWFLDSDCVVSESAYNAYISAIKTFPQADIFIGSYNPTSLEQDPRTPWFQEQNLDPHVYDLSYALACFGGNLVWKIDSFKEVGGFHPDLHMGRCEDGELGLRAASLGKMMVPVKDASVYHIPHSSDLRSKTIKNERDVNLIHEWHGWVEHEGLRVVDKDGKRFDRICPLCGTQVNTGEWWDHEEQCKKKVCVNTKLRKPECSCHECNIQKMKTYFPSFNA